MASTQKEYNFNSVILYDQAFDPKDDLLVSFLRSNEESADLGFLKLQGGGVDSGLLDLQTNTEDRLNLDITNVFDNLCIFLYDSRVPVLTGTSRSSCVSSFATAPLTGISWLSAGQTWYAAPSAISNPLQNPDFYANNYYTSGDGLRFLIPNTSHADGPYGWTFVSNGDLVSGETGPTLVTMISSTSGLQPWEISEYFVPTLSNGPLTPGHAGNKTFGNGLSTYFTNPDTTINVVFSGFKSFGANGNGIERISLSAADPRDFQSPGCNLVNSSKRGGPDQTLITDFGISLSGLLAMAVIDNNGAFGLSGSQRFFYTGGTDVLSAGNFAVRTNTYSSNLIPPAGTELTFDFKGSVTPESYPIVENNWKLHRIGFRRHLQELVLYKREGSTYIPDHIFETGFDISNLPPSVKIGFSYSGQMPMEIRNIAVNGTIVE